MMTDEEQTRIENIVARHTPKVISDAEGVRELSLADRIQLMSMQISEAYVERKGKQ